MGSKKIIGPKHKNTCLIINMEYLYAILKNLMPIIVPLTILSDEIKYKTR